MSKTICTIFAFSQFPKPQIYEMQQNDSNQLHFDQLVDEIKCISLFSEARRRSKRLLSNIFQNSPDSIKILFSRELFRWSQEKLHSRLTEHRLSAISGFAFFIDIVEDQEKLQSLGQTLEKLLPLEVIDSTSVIEGIAYLFKRIAKLSLSPIIPHIIDRCRSWFSVRSSSSAVLSSLFIYYYLCSLDSNFFQRYSSEIDDFVRGAIVFPDNRAQEIAVRLSEIRFNNDPTANETASNLISHLTYLLSTEIEDSAAKGVFMLLSSLLRNNRNVCEERAENLIGAYYFFLKNHSVDDYFEVLIDLCEQLNVEIVKYKDRIYTIFCNKNIKYHKLDNCLKVSRIVKYLPDTFCPYLNDICFSLARISSNCFFCLINSIIQNRPDIVDRQFVLGAMKEAKISSYLVDAAISFAHAYSSDVFKLIHIFTPKIDDSTTFSLSFLANISFLPQFPLKNYWEMAFDCFVNKSEEYHIASIPALTSIIQRFKEDEQQQKLFSLLFEVQNDSASVKIAFLNSIDDKLLPLLISPAQFFIIQELYEDDNRKVRLVALDLISRIRLISPLSTLNFFHNQLHQFPDLYFQIPAKSDQKKFMQLLPSLISSSGDFVISHALRLIKFLLNVLNSRVNQTQNIINRITELKDEKYDCKIRVFALESLSALTNADNCELNLVHDSINAIINLLIQSKQKKLQITAAKTLRSFFRRFQIMKLLESKEIVKIHLQLFQFMRTSTDSRVNNEMLRLFGSIGTLDPYEFHTPHSQKVLEDTYPLYDRAKRDSSFLKFVMKYILRQLKDNIKTHDISVLTNAVSYIFQSDPIKCLVFLKDVVNIFSTMLNQSNYEASPISPSELFHFFKTIVLVVDIEILPYTQTLYDMVFPFLVSNPETEAIKLLNALIYALKSNFSPYGSQTFSRIVSILSDQDNEINQDTEDTLLLSLTLIVIFAGGSSLIYFDILHNIIKKRKIQTSHPIHFLCQVLRNSPAIHLAIPSLRLALHLIKENSSLKDTAANLIRLVILRFPQIINNLPIDCEISQMLETIKQMPPTISTSSSIGSITSHSNSSLSALSSSSTTNNMNTTTNNNSNNTNNINYDDKIANNMNNIELSRNQKSVHNNNSFNFDDNYITDSNLGGISRISNSMTFNSSPSNKLNSIGKNPSEGNTNLDPEAKASFLQQFEPVPDYHQALLKPPVTSIPLSQILSHRRKNVSVMGNDWSSWLLQLSQDLVLCSQSPAIRASHPLLRASPDFEVSLFPYIVVSVWDTAKPEERSLLSNYLNGIVHIQSAPPEVLSAIVSACDAMDRANFALFRDPFISGKVAERCNSYFRAVRFFEKALSTSIEPTSHLLRINSLLKRKEAALGLLNIAVAADSNCELLEALSMWSQARDVYEKKMKENPNSESYIAGFLKCSMHLEDWDKIEKCVDDFSSYSHDTQPKVAMIFAAAVRNTGGNATRFLRAIRTDDPMTCMWRAIIAIDQGNLKDARLWTDRGMSLTCRDMSPFSTGSYEPAIPTICYAMMLDELNDVIDQRRGIKTADEVIDIWNAKADYVKRDATQLRNVYQVREMLQCSNEQLFKIHLSFVDALRRQKEWTLFDNSFKRLFDGSNYNNDERVNLMRAKFRFDRGITKNLSDFTTIIERLSKFQTKSPVYYDAICAYVSRCPISPDIIPLINEVLEVQPNRIRAWKHWAYFNLGCAQPPENGKINESCAAYASNAMKGFAMLVKLTRPSLHFLCQLCALFFTYAENLNDFEAAASNIISLSPSSVIQIIPQLMVQFDHPNKAVREIVFNIVSIFAEHHFQALAMPLCLVKRTPTSSKVLLNFIEKIGQEHNEIMRDAELFANGMLQVAVTDVEMVIELLEKVINLHESDAPIHQMVEVFAEIQRIMNLEHTAFIKTIFQDQKLRNIKSKIDNNMLTKTTASDSQSLSNKAVTIKAFLLMKLESISTIDITEMGIDLCNSTPFSLAVPGFYSVDKEPVTIDSICHVMKLIPSQKRPRKLRIVGSDHRNYKYLLKGREDLRLDLRVMQLFSLTNSILHDDKFGAERHLHIKQVPIVPLAPNAGLIAWAEGGETIYSMIQWHRRIMGVEQINCEQILLRNYVGDESSFGCDRDTTLKLTTLQKLELHLELCKLAPDDDIRESMWLRSPNTELWLGQTTNFARSNGLMSIVGHIIGIGDRHPSNILVMKGTGNVVHIDFSDVFEKANLRTFVHETVPFRLTRMLVRALGASGIHGIFEMTAEYVMALMRRNKETLLAFLDIFIQDPITDTIWYRNAAGQPEEGEMKGSLMKKAIDRVADKLNGREFDKNVSLSPHDQVGKLIEAATSEMNLAQMYYGWAPFW
ncbi:hypothetical protein TRFO_37705 [Tritrichomonas foetus]|uniref:Serine/threonine-protein kinase TOR n=1 Tax=Tritrichomonas foetus TaxID=1144522 RepID=A0A1J4JD01_9EUKA|nr:hypothetical protein TRFO_37705 [Tritrichomonas foetus]|eukprot:OHS96143.1 hypothetical protein TRFO_37705 [Tritrichomonas foetus]